MDVFFLKGPRGSLLPADDEQAEALAKIPQSTLLRVKISRVRNPVFHRKYFALLNYAYEAWKETRPPREWRGREVVTSFERFRDEVQIMAGHYDPVWTVGGELRLQAKTISFAGLDEDGFEALYSNVIDVLLQKVLDSKRFTADKLRKYVDDVLSFV